MQKIHLFLLIAVLFTIPFFTYAFAQTSYDVNIPTGAASPDAPYFWQSEKDGRTSGDVEIITGDSIIWKNADTAAHTVTSGTPEEGHDGKFDSALFAPGKSFSHKFTETGNYPYYCLVHPWMVGTVTVVAGYSVIPDVGKQVGDGSKFFDVEYLFNRVLSSATIDGEQKSITFEIIGDAKSDDNNLELRLPVGLIDGPFVVWVDGQNLSDFEHVRKGDLHVLNIQLDADSTIFTIIGTSIVPEFGPMVMMILGVSVVTMIVLTQRFKLRM